MKNLKLFIFSMVTFLLYTVGVQAQTIGTQYISTGDVKNYTVDAADGPNGTDGSTYTWTVTNSETPAVDITASLGVTNRDGSTSGHAITIDWRETPAGTYVLKVVESANGCIGEERFINVIIGMPILNAPLVDICSNAEAVFTITGAVPGTEITYTVAGGEIAPTVANPIVVDAQGNAEIPVLPTAGSTEVIVTLTQMLLPGTTEPVVFDPAITRSVQITIITTSEIEFD